MYRGGSYRPSTTDRGAVWQRVDRSCASVDSEKNSARENVVDDVGDLIGVNKPRSNGRMSYWRSACSAHCDPVVSGQDLSVPPLDLRREMKWYIEQDQRMGH